LWASALDRYFCRNRKSAITGMAAMIEPAAKYPHCWEKPPTKKRSPTGPV
jgi:hypothetical protein